MKLVYMEVDKFPRIGNNGRGDDWSNKIGQRGVEVEQYPDDEDDGEVKIGGGNGMGSEIGGVGRLSMWPSSRIVRVSRASGGKDRHSKVLTSKGLRDRRVRLSVSTAIQFYDLQDRLRVDQPSKAVEWLLKAASKSIDELPAINTSYPDTPKQLSDEKRPRLMDSAEVELDGDFNTNYQQQQHVSLSKSACSSNSETSKGSGLSLTRSESRVKARERARERRAEKEKEKESETTRASNRPNVNHISQSSFTELLTGGINNVNNSSSNNGGSPNGSGQQYQKTRHWSSSPGPMDYFSSGLLSPSTSRQNHLSGFSAQMGNNLQQPMTISPFNHHHSEMQQHFSFVPDQSDYNLNFSISSSGLAHHAGLNRGTLQSNSQPSSLLPHLQRLSPSTTDGSNVPFFAAAPNAAAMENHHHQFPDGLDGRLQLCYGDSGRQSDHKGKGKN